MNYRKLTFKDIQTSDLIYYDPEFIEDCRSFCDDRDIEFLPSLETSMTDWHKTDDGKFVEDAIPEESRVRGDEDIFAEHLLERFSEYKLLFVYDRAELTGVVHFSDYNRPIINLYLYELLSNFERSLRRLLTKKGFNNRTMWEYFQRKIKKEKKIDEIEKWQRKNDEYISNQQENDRRPPFECFYLSELLCLSNHKEVITITETDPLTKLRNRIMHHNDGVYLKDINRPGFIYVNDTFQIFFKQVCKLRKENQRLSNRLALLETFGLDQRNK